MPLSMRVGWNMCGLVKRDAQFHTLNVSIRLEIYVYFVS